MIDDELTYRICELVSDGAGMLLDADSYSGYFGADIQHVRVIGAVRTRNA